jgi:hypothetical protein
MMIFLLHHARGSRNIRASRAGPGFALIPAEIIACEETGMTEPHFMTIAEASAALRATSLSPIELTQSFLNRIKALSPRPKRN